MGLFGRHRDAPAGEAAELPPLRLAGQPQPRPVEPAPPHVDPFPLPPSPPPPQALELAADRDGARRVHLRLLSRDGAFVVECEARPPGAPAPTRRGPYVFPARAEALAFLDEAAQALAYLGCNVYDPRDVPAGEPVPEPAQALGS